MFDDIDVFDLAAEIRMERLAEENKSFLILEGVNDQKSLYGHIDEVKCSVVIAHRKKNVVELVQHLDHEGFLGALGVVDHDFQNPEYESENLIFSEFRDFDVLIFYSRAFDRFLHFRADKDKIQAVGGPDGVREKVAEAAWFLACLRIANDKRNFGLKFKGLRFDFVDRQNLQVNEGDMIDEVIGNTNAQLDRNEIVRVYNIIKKQGHEHFKCCSGHDVAKVVGIALENLIANLHSRLCGHREVETGLRMCFDVSSFVKTDLFSNVRNWEQENKKYFVLVEGLRELKIS
tara:strand:+ start:1846 stop:2712 length:867 start_codon:yes stop_codon:yes gene_type:complete